MTDNRQCPPTSNLQQCESYFYGLVTVYLVSSPLIIILEWLMLKVIINSFFPFT